MALDPRVTIGIGLLLVAAGSWTNSLLTADWGFAEFALAGQIFLLVGDEPGQAGDVLDLAAGFFDQGRDIRKRLVRLRDEVTALEFLLRVPADLAGQEHHAPFGNDAVGEALADRCIIKKSGLS